MRATSTRFLPLLVSVDDTRYGEEHLLDEFTEDMFIGYAFGPPYGARLVTWEDLDRLRLGGRVLRRTATENLYTALTRLRIHGQPPALMLSFDGLESSVLLVDEFWDDLERSVPGELVIGVPARDVVIITGSESPPGLEKARRAVDRVFFAGDQHLLSRDLLVWRDGIWRPFRPTGAWPVITANRGEPQEEPISGPPRRPVSGPVYRPISGPVYRSTSGPPAEPVSGSPVEPVSGPPSRQQRPAVRWSEAPDPQDWEDDDPEAADWDADEPDPPHWTRPPEPPARSEPPPRSDPPPSPRGPGRPPVRWSEAPPPERERRRRPSGPFR